MTSHKQLLYYVSLCACFDLIIGAPRASIANNEENKNRDLTTDLENWMTKLPENIRAVPIKNLAIPGSHDSFTSDITGESDVSPDGEEILQILGQLKTAKIIISNWSKAQGFNVIQQLQAGIRFFDLRFCRNSNDGNVYFCHGMYSSEVQGVLNNMASYLAEHPQEVVILDCQHFYDFSSETHNNIIQLLMNTFESQLVPYQSNMEPLTLEYLASQKKQKNKKKTRQQNRIITVIVERKTARTKIKKAHTGLDMSERTLSEATPIVLRVQWKNDAKNIQVIEVRTLDWATSYLQSFLAQCETNENTLCVDLTVIIIYRDASQSGQELLWPSESFPTPWYDTMDSSKLLSDLNNGIRNKSPNVGLVSQCILTPQVQDILAGLLSSLRQKCAVDFETNRINWISSQIPGETGVNIIINDFIELSDNLFSKTVISLNTKLSTEIEYKSGYFEKIRSFGSRVKGWF